LQNPSIVDPGLSNVMAPTAASEYAVTSLSINFFADEREQVDFAMVFDEDSVADDEGALTSSDGNVLAFTPGNDTTDLMTVETGDLLAVARVLGFNDLSSLVGSRLEITVGPGLTRTWQIASLADGTDPGTKDLALTQLSGSGAGTPSNRSEYRLEGGDTHGRIVGFGMGPNVIIGGRVQPGGVTYGDMEVLLMNLGSGTTIRRTTPPTPRTIRPGAAATPHLTMLNTARATIPSRYDRRSGARRSTPRGQRYRPRRLSTLPCHVRRRRRGYAYRRCGSGHDLWRYRTHRLRR
jgi:hypothetical protein